MKKRISKTLALKQIKEFFENIKEKKPKQIKKTKKLAMSQNIKLKDKRKLFCKKCLAPYQNPKIRIKNKIKSITCEHCGYISRWKILLN
jgi:RNase P subunit RPR2|tara:strand:- start:23 stop:289 length:267 start_codon:yes stop_codon:yes gene_type:complete